MLFVCTRKLGRRVETDGREWLREHEEEVENLKAMEIDALCEALVGSQPSD